MLCIHFWTCKMLNMHCCFSPYIHILSCDLKRKDVSLEYVQVSFISSCSVISSVLECENEQVLNKVLCRLCVILFLEFRCIVYVEFFSSVWHTLQSQSLGCRRMSIIQVSCWKKFWGTEHGAHTHTQCYKDKSVNADQRCCTCSENEGELFNTFFGKIQRLFNIGMIQYSNN